MSDTHQLTEAERKLLEDCPRESVLDALKSKYVETFNVIRWRNGHTCILRSQQGEIADQAYLTRPAVEQWLAEQDEREAEIERRIGEMIQCSLEVADFENWETKYPTFYLGPSGVVRYWDTGNSIPVPRERIRAAIDAKRAADKAKEPDMQESEGPCKAIYDDDGPMMWRVWRDGNLLATWFCGDSDYTEPEARALAEAEAARLNAKHRFEQADREAEAIKQRRIAGFVETRRNYGTGDWWWICKDSEYYLNKQGWAMPGKSGDTITVPRAELEDALRAAGIEELLAEEQERAIRARVEFARQYAKDHNGYDVRELERNYDIVYLSADAGWNSTLDKKTGCTVRVTQAQIAAWEKANPEPEPVTISPELRARLEAKLVWCAKMGMRFEMAGECWDVFYLSPLGVAYQRQESTDFVRCTAQQARAFLAEKGVKP